MTLEDKILRVEELARQKRKIDAELLSLLGGETRKGRPPKITADAAPKMELGGT